MWVEILLDNTLHLYSGLTSIAIVLIKQLCKNHRHTKSVNRDIDIANINSGVELAKLQRQKT